MMGFNYSHLEKFCKALEKEFKDYPYGKLTITRCRTARRLFTDMCWEADDGWYIKMRNDINARMVHTKEFFTNTCYDIYYNVLDMYVCLVKHVFEEKSNDNEFIDKIIKGVIDNA